MWVCSLSVFCSQISPCVHADWITFQRIFLWGCVLEFLFFAFTAITSQSCLPLSIAIDCGRSFKSVQDAVSIALIKFIAEFVFLGIKIAAFHKVHRVFQSVRWIKSFRGRVQPRLVSTEVTDTFVATQIKLKVQLCFVVALDVFIKETCRITSVLKVDHRWHISRMAWFTPH